MALVPYVQGSAGRGSALAPTSSRLAPILKPTATVVKKTAAPGAKTVVAKTTVAQPPAAAPNYATLMAQAATQASKLAAQQIAAQVKAITDQQTQLHATASAQAAEINKASLAAAQFLSGLGDMTKSDYTAAVQNLAGMTGGYTGALRDTAQQAADAAQAQLSSIPGNEQTAVNRGNDLANLVYGVSGQIPANALTVQGLGATELARAEPGRELSYGQQQAIGQLGAGNKAADALNAQIATIRATLPSTTSTYLSQFEKSAQDQITNARNARTDALNAKNIGSEIAARKATDKRLTKAAAAKAKTDAAKLLLPDATQTKLAGGILTSVSGKPITRTIKGVQYLQTGPGYHFDNTGRPVPDPKPTDPLKIAALAAEWTGKLHYLADSGGNPRGGKITPIGGWVVSPDGQSAVPPAKPGKAFMPKIDRIGSTAAKALVYIGEDGALHFFKNAAGGKIPYDPTKPVALQAKNVGGYWETFDPSTGVWSRAVDDSGVPLIAGTPKAPPAVHYGAPKVGRDGYYYTLDPSTGTMKRTDVLAPEKATATHYSGRYPGADGYWHVYDTSTAADIRLPTKVPAKTAAAGSWRMIKEPDGTIKFYNPTTQVTRDTPFKEAVSGPRGKPLTPTWVQSHGARLNAALDRMQHGWLGKDASTGKPKQFAPYTRAEAIAALREQNYFSSPQMKQFAMNLLNKYFPKPGTTVSRLPSGPAALGLIPRIPGDIIGQPAG